jgi:putative hydrolase of the HAD superfamily
MFDAIIFDLDDTLYRERDFLASGYSAVAHHLAAIHACDYEEVYASMMNALDRFGRRSVLPLTIRRFSRATASMEELVQVYRHHEPTISLSPGCSDLLSHLAGNFKLGIITDGLPQVQRRKVRALGLEELVHKVIYTWEFGVDKEKPHPFAFNLMKEALEVEADKTLFVGDNPVKDCDGAKAAGMRSALFCLPENGTVKFDLAAVADFAVASWSQLGSILLHVN